VSAQPLDLGAPVSHLAVEEGTPVYDAAGRRIGVVEHVLEEAGIFEGVIVHTHPLPGRHRYADADQIAGLHERGVRLAVGAEALHDPGERRRERAGEPAASGLEARLRRAWDWIVAHT
jgi:hypothetical protein